MLKKRLLYLSQHRGMREMDILLGNFAKKNIGGMNQSELKQFEAVLICADQALYEWLFKGGNAPEGIPVSLLQAIKKSSNT
ncbi:MAG: succinate dehydrogenase assembly factor 2 [Alphaproteobacteria bacterium]|nr:succinate dehydrogenase assembly factor 2 [Alphaproteobacteria bacterium]